MYINFFIKWQNIYYQLIENTNEKNNNKKIEEGSSGKLARYLWGAKIYLKFIYLIMDP